MGSVYQLYPFCVKFYIFFVFQHKFVSIFINILYWRLCLLFFVCAIYSKMNDLKGLNNTRTTNDNCECDEYSQLKSLIIILLDCFYNYLSLISFIFLRWHTLLKNAKKAFPLKFSSSQGKRRWPWTTAEDTALVQFVALHQEYLPANKSWPSFGAKNAYWKEAANYVNQSTKSSISRSGK